jgi:alkylation response protein AidB-like acyl-CoA dehydrogenase
MWISNACSLFIVFARIGDENITGFIIENDADNGISMGEEHKLGIRASSTRQVFFNEKRVLLKTCFLKEEMVK